MPIDLKLYSEHIEGRSLVEVLLRGHLWVERHLISLLEAELSRPEALNLDRMAFSQKVKLADALGMLSPDEVETLRVLNGMRNRLAHDLSGQPGEEDIARLEASVPNSQRSLAQKLLEVRRQRGRGRRPGGGALPTALGGDPRAADRDGAAQPAARLLA